MVFKNGAINIQAADYIGAHTVVICKIVVLKGKVFIERYPNPAARIFFIHGMEQRCKGPQTHILG
jgi:hypothetical protein